MVAAEAIAGVAVKFVIEKLVLYTTDEACLLRGLDEKFSDLKDELEIMQAFIMDAERRAAVEGDSSCESIRAWLKQLRDTAYLIQDVTDEYKFYVDVHARYRYIAEKLFHYITTIYQHHQIAFEVQRINSSLLAIRGKIERYNLQPQPCFEPGGSSSSTVVANQSHQWHDPRLASLYIVESEVVGIEAPK
ncbi:hypothetical protein RIF29_41364 [Crotalaria pallida]|uniref:Disease resistance N-terminal domain-containing protein n=1 Tax=Crotalaria pallida TaxID=3830 RepID=A0AAN9HPA7_CROPI